MLVQLPKYKAAVVGGVDCLAMYRGGDVIWRGAAPVWTPAQLFSAGQLGAWYDPSDISTLFQDAAGTTPVTASGQPVGRMLDKSGRGNHATQATAGFRPIYTTGGGLSWLAFDGIDDQIAGGSFRPSADFYIIAAVTIMVRQGIGEPLWATNTLSTSDDAMGLYTRTDVVQDSVAALRIGTGTAYNVQQRGDYNIGSPFVTEGYQESNTLSVRVNNGTIASTAAAVGAGLGNPMSLKLGSSASPQMRFYGGAFVKDVVSITDKALSRTYIGAQAGLVL